MRIRQSGILILAFTGLIGCKSSFIVTPEQQQVLAKHRTVSILPTKVIFDETDTLREKGADYEKKEGYYFQSQFQNILEKNMNKYTVIFQDISKTNILLDNEGLDYDSLFYKNPSELGKILGTDAILADTIHKYKPVMTYVSPTNMYYTGYYVYRTTVEISATIYNCSDGKPIWHGTRYVSENTYSYTSEQLGTDLIDEISGHLPYKRK